MGVSELRRYPGVHHDGSEIYVPERSPRLGATVRVYVRVAADAGVDAVWARTTFDAEPRFTPAEPVPVSGDDRWFEVPLLLRNPVIRYRFLLAGPAGYRWLTAAGVVAHDVPDDTDFRMVCDDPAPDWARDAVVYLIFPDRFARSSAAAGRSLPDWALPRDWDDPVTGAGPDRPREVFGGDLDGISERLDHIAALGADSICLTPIFTSPSNHRYCAASFDEIDPLLGGEAALTRLAEAVHRRGWRLLGDLTTNHTGDQHPWFREARDGRHPDLYYFTDDAPHGYETWVHVKRMPKLNWTSPELRRRMTDGPESVVRRWIRAGLDGWRLDVANSTGRCMRDDTTHEVMRQIRAAMLAERPDALLIGENAHDATRDVDQGGWHGTMNYAGFTRPVWTWLATRPSAFLGVPTGIPRLSAGAMLATMTAFAARMSWPSRVTSWSLLDSHDTPRFRTLVGGDRRLIEVGVGLMVTLPGTPMIFAGDEIGLDGAYAEDARRPMPWHRADRWDQQIFATYRALVALRRRSAALGDGGLRTLHVTDDMVVFCRENKDQRLLVLAARAPATGPVVVPAAAHAVNLYGGAPDVGADGSLPTDGPTFQVWHLPSEDVP
ncbi:glycoside hydrolase family 13 protein [Micromonospora schwarzwaldensis]|uniref:glycoside hydrolase family 13 protein n=1 Tax=Micromonospora sp. DSM 45708 TaxID=3111767 RepID=UPI0031D8D472